CRFHAQPDRLRSDPHSQTAGGIARNATSCCQKANTRRLLNLGPGKKRENAPLSRFFSKLLDLHSCYESLQRGAYLVRRIFLDEMNASHLDLSLIWPSSAEFQRAADQNRTRFGGDKQLGQIAFGQPFAILRDYGDDIGGLAFDRQLARPYQHRTPCVAI